MLNVYNVQYMYNVARYGRMLIIDQYARTVYVYVPRAQLTQSFL